MRPKNNNLQPTIFAGTKVKCIVPMSKGDKEFCRSIGYSFPVVGRTYTVRQNHILTSTDSKMILLEEIKNPNFYTGSEIGFFASSFKVLNNSNHPGAIHGPIKWDFPDYIKQMTF
ncbi:MAG TPA: hypothetical protein VNZ49_08385 [Bacteroidia bacterium]|jgi:hypothetical protein|nr:hypothetical protein [Bacteroidia bacterium]